MKFLQISTLSLLAGIVCYSAGALESDDVAPVLYEHTGNLVMDISGNIRTLTMFENVKVTQGSMVIQGDEGILEYRVDTGELVRVTVHGTPVQYEQQVNEAGEIVTGNSNTIEFFTDELGETIVELTGNASIVSPDTSMNCQAITYLTDQNLFSGTGPCSGALSRQDN